MEVVVSAEKWHEERAALLAIAAWFVT